MAAPMAGASPSGLQATHPSRPSSWRRASCSPASVARTRDRPVPRSPSGGRGAPAGPGMGQLSQGVRRARRSPQVVEPIPGELKPAPQPLLDALGSIAEGSVGLDRERRPLLTATYPKTALLSQVGAVGPLSALKTKIRSGPSARGC